MCSLIAAQHYFNPPACSAADPLPLSQPATQLCVCTILSRPAMQIQLYVVYQIYFIDYYYYIIHLRRIIQSLHNVYFLFNFPLIFPAVQHLNPTIAASPPRSVVV
jgi:hypothetical protein